MPQPTLATDPPKSESQRRLMWAAAAGHGTSGVSQSVAKEFTSSDPGGKLPEKSGKDMEPTKRGIFARLFRQWIEEELSEPEHSAEGGDTVDSEPPGISPGAGPRAASIAFVAKDGTTLFVKRASNSDNFPDTWEWPGGKAEEGEDDKTCAAREALEEIGDCQLDGLKAIDQKQTPQGWTHTSFGAAVDKPFHPTLNDEHSEFRWAPITNPPLPLHPGVKATIDTIIGKGAEPAPADPTRPQEIAPPAKDDPPPMATAPNGGIPAGGGGSTSTDPDAKLLLRAHARRAQLKGRGDIARRLDRLRERRFGNATEDDEPIESRFEMALGGQYLKDKQTGKYFDVEKLLERFGSGTEDASHDLAIDRALALDRRVYDASGRLHVDQANISKAAVNEYLGKEINEVMQGKPGWQMLNPAKRYKMLRHPDEIKKAVGTFNGLPILWQHKPTSAADHPSEITIGATGNDAIFEHPYLKNSLSIWPAYASHAIEGGDQKELSCGYAYRADMTPGNFEGQKYDGVMRDLIGNHLALVKEGRAGSDVAVDEEIDARLWRNIEHALLVMGAPREVRI